MSLLLQRQARFTQDSLPVRLGGIAANLARVTSFGKNPQNHELIANLFQESAWFIEWSAPETSLDFALELVNIQRQIVQWLANWPALWNDQGQRTLILERSHQWSDTILRQSGLLD